MNERLRLRLAPIVAGLLFAVPAAAQAPASAPADAASHIAGMPVMTPTAPAEPAALRSAEESRNASAANAPSLEGLRAGVRAEVARDEVRTMNTVAVQRRGLSQPEVLMIVGGAALLAGAIIGDDAGTLIMIGGAGIGLWGLYLYLQ